MRINCAIVDDDRVAIKLISNLIERVSYLNLVASYPSAEDFISGSLDEKSEPIELLFLDIEMPGMSGIDMLKNFDVKPYVVIISSTENYAVDAFLFEVVDYVVKPITLPRFIKAVEKVHKLMGEKNNPHLVSQDMFFKTDHGLVRFAEDDIYYIEALENYIKLVTPFKNYIIYHTLKSVAGKLPKQFVRVHRSYIVNVNRINSIQSNIISISLKKETASIPIGKVYQKPFFDKINLV